MNARISIGDSLPGFSRRQIRVRRRRDRACEVDSYPDCMSDDAERPATGSARNAFASARVMPAWGAVIGGVIATFRGATGDLGSIFLIAGPVLIVLGVIGMFVVRWMAKRGL
jgi:hypothetical protein